LAHLEEFKKLHKVNMKIDPKKCEFIVTSVVYLGHIILPNGILAHWAKVIAILEMPNCRNLSIGLATKAKGCKVASQKGSPGVMPHAPNCVRECEGIDPHIPKGTPTLGVGVPMDSQMFRERLQG
jgi:hypothetical protein